jgi:putative DNA primase/helicase
MPRVNARWRIPDQEPPRFSANADAERSILGAILLDNSAYSQAAILAPDDFSLDSHRRIYTRMRDLVESFQPIDMITLTEELRCRNELEVVGDVGYISGLIDGVPDRPSIERYVQIVLQYAARRRFAKDAEDAQRLALDPNVPATALAEAGNRLSEVAIGSDALPPRFSEESLALRFSRRYADSLRYVNEWGCWMSWDGCRWREDCTLDVFDRVRAICREASAECGNDEKTGIRLASKLTVAAVERLIQSDRRHAATAGQWDADPWLLNTTAGTVDLRTGEMQEHRRENYITNLTATGPGGDCPLWLRFLDRITAGDEELQSFLQRMIGYCLTGSTKEHALFFMYGTGANGKSVFLSTVAGLLGDYAKTAPVSIFTVSNTEQHPTDLAGLRGARFVTAIETEDGRWWAEARIKSLTGGDRITARFMRQDFFEYIPQFKLIVAGNHKPGLRNVDEAIRRRLHLIPFTVTIAEHEQDPDLGTKLKAECPGILQWAIEGCVRWNQEGLNPPPAVRHATEGYLAAEDVVGRWLEERCIRGTEYWTAGAVLFADFQSWCEHAGERAGTQKRFSQVLEGRGFVQERTRRARGFAGIGLLTDVTDVTGLPVMSVHARA